jgi:murein DD-endopeptidase MepM/ murein hydrolase activator NlpD
VSVRHSISSTLLGILIILLSACSTTPKKPTNLPNTQIDKLKNLRLDNRLPVPIKGINRNELRDTWGAARNQGRNHEGIDIMAERGTKVYSATEGLVADLRNNNLGGKIIWIIGPAGSWHYYAHLDDHKRGLNVGDYVRKGDLIGYVGNTGNARATAPHLHYGIYLNGKGRGAVNPYPYLR